MLRIKDVWDVQGRPEFKMEKMLFANLRRFIDGHKWSQNADGSENTTCLQSMISEGLNCTQYNIEMLTTGCRGKEDRREQGLKVKS